MKEQIKILVGTDLPVLAHGLHFILENGFPGIITKTAESRQDLMDLANALSPDLLIIHTKIPGMFKEETLNADNEFMSNHKVLLISSADEKDEIYKLHKLNISGYSTLQAQSDDHIESVKAILKGAKYFSPKVVEVLIELSFQKARPEKETQLHENLSDREMEVFMLVTQGKSTKEIADSLFLSTHTVYTHRKNILKKLSCKSAAELINYAYAQGLLDKE